MYFICEFSNILFPVYQDMYQTAKKETGIKNLRLKFLC